MWIGIFVAFVLVTVSFGRSEHQESSSGHPQSAIAEVAEPDLASHADRAPASHRRD